MRVCVLYAAAGKDTSKIKEISDGIAQGILEQGHQVDIFDMKKEDKKIISFYDYIVVGAEGEGTFGGKIPSVVAQFLGRAGKISGKRCTGFVTKPGLRSTKTLQAVMKAMESEGMYLKNSVILKKKDEAKAVGKRLHIDTN